MCFCLSKHFIFLCFSFQNIFFSKHFFVIKSICTIIDLAQKCSNQNGKFDSLYSISWVQNANCRWPNTIVGIPFRSGMAIKAKNVQNSSKKKFKWHWLHPNRRIRQKHRICWALAGVPKMPIYFWHFRWYNSWRMMGAVEKGWYFGADGSALAGPFYAAIYN